MTCDLGQGQDAGPRLDPIRDEGVPEVVEAGIVDPLVPGRPPPGLRQAPEPHGLSVLPLSEDEAADVRAVFGFDLEPYRSHVSRLPMYAPMMRRGLRNLPVRSATWRNVHFAGNDRTFPSILSTGTAIESGIATARDLARDLRGGSPAQSPGSR